MRYLALGGAVAHREWKNDVWGGVMGGRRVAGLWRLPIGHWRADPPPFMRPWVVIRIGRELTKHENGSVRPDGAIVCEGFRVGAGEVGGRVGGELTVQVDVPTEGDPAAW